MGQQKAAAQRKIGFTARLYYFGFGLIALIWFLAFSLEHVIGVMDAVSNRSEFLNFDGRKALQDLFLLLAAISAVVFVLVGSRYSIIKAPRIVSNLEVVSVGFLVAFISVPMILKTT